VLQAVLERPKVRALLRHPVKRPVDYRYRAPRGLLVSHQHLVYPKRARAHVSDVDSHVLALVRAYLEHHAAVRYVDYRLVRAFVGCDVITQRRAVPLYFHVGRGVELEIKVRMKYPHRHVAGYLDVARHRLTGMRVLNGHVELVLHRVLDGVERKRVYDVLVARERNGSGLSVDYRTDDHGPHYRLGRVCLPIIIRYERGELTRVIRRRYFIVKVQRLSEPVRQRLVYFVLKVLDAVRGVDSNGRSLSVALG